MSKAEKYLPFLLAALVPVIGAINNPVSRPLSAGPAGLLLYAEIVSVLLLIWYYNRWLIGATKEMSTLAGRAFSMIGANLLLIMGVSLLDYWLIPRGVTANQPLGLMVFRLSLVAWVFNMIQRVFNAQRESASLKLQNLSLQAENLKFEVDVLKQQINPHFLFNSLNTLLDLIEGDPPAAAKYTRIFSNLYRVVLQSSQYDFVPLADELQFLNDYWSLLKMRFHDAIDLHVEISDDKMQTLIPPLSLQFLIENAVKHNEASKRVPLTVTIAEEDDALIIRNSLQPKPYAVNGEQLGLKNLQKRFSVLHKPIEYGIIDDNFRVKLPLKVA